MILLLFFIYIFPLAFLAIPAVTFNPYFATAFLGLGLVLWLVLSFLIYRLGSVGRNLIKSHQEIQERGKLVKAQIIDYKKVGVQDGHPSMDLTLSFTNLANNQVQALINVVDSKAEQKRYEIGNTVDIKLNRQGYRPPFTMGQGDYEANSSIFLRLWPILNLAYMVGFFLVSYYLKSRGQGWRFMGPTEPWFWAPLTGIFFFVLLGRSFDHDIVDTKYKVKSFKSKEDLGKLILYGKADKAEILDFSRTGLLVNDQPQIRFSIYYINDRGEEVYENFKQIIDLTDLHKLKKGEVDIIYLPQEKHIFMLDMK